MLLKLKGGIMKYKTVILVLLSISLLFVFSCGPKPVAPKAALDTPEHHVSNGNKLLKANKIEDAFKEFNRAKDLNPKFSPAYVGLGLVYGLRNDFENGFKSLKKAAKYSKGKPQELAVLIGNMRLYIMGQTKIHKKWLQKVNHLYVKAKRNAPKAPEPYFYMGLAYKHAFEFRKAAREFTKVLDINKGFVEAADKEYAVIQKIERAMPGSSVGKQIAILDQIARADAAALFIQELKVDELFKKRAPKKFDTAFKSPEKKVESSQSAKTAPAIDIDDHVLKTDIDAVIEIGINGLQPYPDHTFQPDKMINRAEFAMMLEDIIVKITRDEGLATQFVGNNSPFPDLRNDLPFFNAVMVATTRGVMQVKDAGTGEFAPRGLVSGADALLSIRTLKVQLDKY